MAGLRNLAFVRRILFLLFVVALVVVSVGPIYYFITVSLKTEADAIAVPPDLFLFKPTFRNYPKVFTEQPFDRYLVNSIVISLGTVLSALVIGIPAGYALSRLQMKFKNGLLFSILAMRMIPPICLALPFFLLFNGIGLIDTKRGLVLVYLTFSLPLVIWMMRTFFDDIPEALEEAALVDGATPFQTFYRIALPLVKQGIVTSGILTWVLSWNEFLFAMILTRRAARTAPVGINAFLRFQDLTWGTIAASSVTVMAPVILIAFLLRTYLIRGWTLGALKG
ncbi:ABC transporter permease subunit [candidate division KSB3 bacterium]|uniref:ABC transporter permease subunit n=1 Tax=candidate division KSB3 bacterium TaxID=2044937 RepID=A0A9D5JRU3_9BACT|nr:ABC transporter permease subunit [candidate division KSB3 bacterium]MBD3323087.1 ABC transporter permease subunit [candidate division KSB3 bacterium]